MSAHLRLIEPSNKNRSVAPGRVTNAELRSREYLTPAEVEKLAKAARDGRHGHRDATLILIAFRHGLRAVELCDLEWSQVEFGRVALQLGFSLGQPRLFFRLTMSGLGNEIRNNNRGCRADGRQTSRGWLRVDYGVAPGHCQFLLVNAGQLLSESLFRRLE